MLSMNAIVFDFDSSKRDLKYFYIQSEDKQLSRSSNNLQHQHNLLSNVWSSFLFSSTICEYLTPEGFFLELPYLIM